MGIFQSGPLRAPGAPQTVFADAQTDGHARGRGRAWTPLAFRLQNMLTDSTEPALVGRPPGGGARRRAGSRGSPGSNLGRSGNIVTGRGIANGHHGGAYAAVVADVPVNKKTGKISVTHLYGAQDSGFAVNPNLVDNQMVGNLIQATSRALWEEVTFNKNQVTSVDWVTYPILRFADAPKVTTVLVQRPDQPSLGSGEPVTCPSSARSRTRSTTRPAPACTRLRSPRAASAPR